MLNGFQNIIFSGIDYKPFYSIHNFLPKKTFEVPARFEVSKNYPIFNFTDDW